MELAAVKIAPGLMWPITLKERQTRHASVSNRGSDRPVMAAVAAPDFCWICSSLKGAASQPLGDLAHRRASKDETSMSRVDSPRAHISAASAFISFSARSLLPGARWRSSREGNGTARSEILRRGMFDFAPCSLSALLRRYTLR
jgi:hypothetical protein